MSRPIVTPRPRVLIVEDEELISEVLTELLCPRFEVVRARSGREASVALEHYRGEFFLVLTDLVMVDGSGLELYRSIETGYPLLRNRVIFLTGTPKTESRKLLEGISNPYLEKPVDLDQLLELVERFSQSSSSSFTASNSAASS